MSSPKLHNAPLIAHFYINAESLQRETSYVLTDSDWLPWQPPPICLQVVLSVFSCLILTAKSKTVRTSLPSSNIFLYFGSGVTVSMVSCRYFVCVAVLLYFLPLLVMGCAYLVVGLTLWASEIPGDSSDRYKEQLTAKRKVTCT